MLVYTAPNTPFTLLQCLSKLAQILKRKKKLESKCENDKGFFYWFYAKFVEEKRKVILLSISNVTVGCINDAME